MMRDVNKTIKKHKTACSSDLKILNLELPVYENFEKFTYVFEFL